MAAVKHVAHDDGSHSLGVVIGKKYVPLLRVPPERVTQLVAEAEADEGDNGEDEKGGDE